MSKDFTFTILCTTKHVLKVLLHCNSLLHSTEQGRIVEHTFHIEEPTDVTNLW